ncbi:MAG: metal-dependent transcriptional regulator [Lachnospiraceae bacterium]|nr:metal-dependent transcriptional regulator [Lachnospiraceae bacterium]
MKSKSNESVEMYLESILTLGEKLPVVRSVDVANDLGFKKSSVSVAMKNLEEKNYIIRSEQGYINLTTDGKAYADKIYDRHKTLTAVLEKLGVDPETAEADACKMEHIISEETFQAIKRQSERSDS